MERPITEKKGSNTLVGTNFNNLPDIVFNKLKEDSIFSVPDLWDGNASERIVEVIDVSPKYYFIKYHIFRLL